jgi:protein-tyrosine phosphatase
MGDIRKRMAVEVIPTPFGRSYRVVPGQFLAGAYPGVMRLDQSRALLEGLLDAGIRFVVNLTPEFETELYGLEAYEETLTHLAEGKGLRVECLRVPIRDTGIPTVTKMKMILDEVDGAMDQGKPVYVHCLAGRGRTGTVVGCWLMRHGKATAGKVLAMIKDLRKSDPASFQPSPENDRQRLMVTSWKPGQ